MLTLRNRCTARAASLALVVPVIIAFTHAAPALGQDLNANSVEDPRDLRLGNSGDCNRNGFVDERDANAPHFTQAIEHLNAVEGEQFQNNVWDAQPIDFNNDGLMDLVVTSMYSTNTGGVSFWRNEGGAGLVHAYRILTDNTRPYTIRVADLNNDGRQDFVASDSSYNQAYVYLATGDETFAPPVTLLGPAANNGSVGIDLGDLDNDGDLDLAWTCWYPAGVNTFYNNGSGVFSFGETFTTGAEPRDIAIGDFSGDGLADIVTANQFYYNAASGTASLHRNTGGPSTGRFALQGALTMPLGVPPYNYQSEPQFVELADVDGDGDRDLVTSSNDSNTLAIHANDGAGNFTLAQTIGGWWLESDARDVLVADLDGDKAPELIWGDVALHKVAIYKRINGSFQHVQNYASTNYGGLQIAAADFSGDGEIDLVTANDTSRSVCVLVNKGALRFDATIQLRPDEFPGSAQLADFTGDGITDFFVIRAPYSGLPITMSVYPGLSANDADFSNTPIDTAMPLGQGYIHCRDVNADGKPDILSVTGHCRVYLGNGNGTFAPAIASPITPVGVRLVTGDVNGDNKMDLAWVWPGHPSLLRVSFGDGLGNFAPHAEYTDVAEDQAIALGDITGDGKPEIVVGHRYGIVSIHTNNGDGTFGTRRDITIAGTPLNPTIGAAAIADFDMDGDRDIVASGLGLYMFHNPGDGNVPNTPVVVGPYSASMLHVTDIDLDGTPDLYGRSTRALVYLNTSGTGAFDPPLQLRHYDSNARYMIVADANNDGRQDLMIGPENSWSQYLFLNTPAFSSDFNGDSIPDECQTPMPGDTNGDGQVNVTDLLAVIGAWGSCQPAPANCPADFNNDGVVNVTDLLTVIANWG